MKIEGWLGGSYNELGMYKSKEDADRGILPESKLDDLLEYYKGKNVSITIVEQFKLPPRNPNRKPTKINMDRSTAEMREKDRELINKLKRGY